MYDPTPPARDHQQPFTPPPQFGPPGPPPPQQWGPPGPPPPPPAPEGSGTGKIVLIAVLVVIVLAVAGVVAFMGVGEANKPKPDDVAYPQDYRLQAEPVGVAAYQPDPIDDPCSYVNRDRLAVLLPVVGEGPSMDCEFLFEHEDYDENGHMATMTVFAEAYETVEEAVDEYQHEAEYWAAVGDQLSSDGLEPEALLIGYGGDARTSVFVMVRSENLVVMVGLSVEDRVDGSWKPDVPTEVLRGLSVDTVNEVLMGIPR